MNEVTNNLMDAAQANTLAAVQQQVQDWNNVIKSNYLTAFDNWSQSVLAGRADNTNPPQPPKAYVVGHFTDPTSGPGSIGPYGEQPIFLGPVLPEAHGASLRHAGGSAHDQVSTTPPVYPRARQRTQRSGRRHHAGGLSHQDGRWRSVAEAGQPDAVRSGILLREDLPR